MTGTVMGVPGLALADEEVAYLLRAAERGPVFRRLAGTDRAMLYTHTLIEDERAALERLPEIRLDNPPTTVRAVRA